MNKTELITKLIKEDKISFEDALLLMQTEKEYIYVQPQIVQQPYPLNPWYNPPLPYYITCSSGNLDYNNCGLTNGVCEGKVINKFDTNSI